DSEPPRGLRAEDNDERERPRARPPASPRVARRAPDFPAGAAGRVGSRWGIQTSDRTRGKMPGVSEASLREGYLRLGLLSVDHDLPKLLILKDFLKFYGRSMNLTASLDDAALDEHLLEG